MEDGSLAKNENNSGENLFEILAFMDMKDGQIFKSRCKICNSSLRDKAEEHYASGKPIAFIQKFLTDGGEADITNHLVKHHMKEHYDALERRAQMVEYMESLAAVAAQRRNRMSDIQMTIDMAMVELVKIAGLSTGGDLYKDKERISIQNMLWKSIREGIAQLSEMQGAEAQIQAMNVKFINMWKEVIQDAKSDQEKQVLVSTLQRFKVIMNEAEQTSEEK